MMSYITRSRKYPYHGQLFRNSEGILQLEIKRDGGILHDWNFSRDVKGGGECVTLLIWNFPGVSQECIP